MKFKVIGKSLILTDCSHKITEGENSFDTVEVIVPNSHDDCAISTLNFRFSEISEDGKTSAVQILRHTKCDEKYIYLKGMITSDFSAITGKVIFMLTGINDENVVAKFQSTPYTISDDISLASLPNVTVAEQFFNQTQLEVQKAKEAAERAEQFSKTPAPAEIYPAANKRLGGILSGTDISVDEIGNATVNSVNGKTIGKSVPNDAVFTDTVYNDADINNKLSEIISYLGYTDDIIGLHADFENSVFSRLSAAVGLNGGADFDKFPMYSGRKRCNVLDDGTITAYYGDKNFSEDGSNGQVMVYQPKFYYKVVPLKLVPQTDGCGYHLRSANYYISATPKSGFKLHPAFYDENGKPIDHILFSAYEGSIFDASANAYLANDEQTADFSADKLSSIANVKPCSGKSQNLTRANAEKLAQNRGKGWHCDTIKAESANQMLMAIEFASFNLKAFIGNGVCLVPDDADQNCSIITGKTSQFGNLTGGLLQSDKQSPISYRGVENPWGNMYKFVNGIIIHGNGMQKGGIPYICSNFNFSESISNENYFGTEFTVSNSVGFISSFGYSSEFDWLFLASETKASLPSPVDSYMFAAANLNGDNISILGGCWLNDIRANCITWALNSGSNYRQRYIGSRLIYIKNT